MPLFSDHISNMYYSGSPYSSAPYGYSSSVTPYGSFSASYLNPGGNYSSHSSISGYSRTPLTSRWIMNGGRSYSPMLSTISEKGSHSPVRINSPRRIPLSSRTYIPSSYTPRPININTADIDVSRDRYRSKLSDSGSNSVSSSYVPLRRESPQSKRDNSPAAPEVIDKPNVGIDTSPGPIRSTIKRDRTVVRLHTVKRKDRDSPRKPAEVSDLQNKEVVNKYDQPSETTKWREKLASDLAYNVKKDKKTLGAKLVEKFHLKDVDDQSNVEKTSLGAGVEDEKNSNSNKRNCGRRCSMELLAEQASLFDSLIQNENLNNTTLDISKVGIDATENVEKVTNIKKRKLSGKQNELATTQSDHSIHNRVLRENDHLRGENRQLIKRKSIKKSLSGGSICKLDCISELPKIEMSVNISRTEEIKTKSKQKITSSVVVSDPPSPIKFFVENVIVEEIPKQQKKDIIFTSSIDTDNSILFPENCPRITPEHRKSVKSKSTPHATQDDSLSADVSSGNNFWDTIGKRETIYLTQRREKLTEEKNQRLFHWFPEVEDEYALDESKSTHPIDKNKFNVTEEQDNDSSKNVTDDLSLSQKIEEFKETTEGNETNPDIEETLNAKQSVSSDLLRNTTKDPNLLKSLTQIEEKHFDGESNEIYQNKNVIDITGYEVPHIPSKTHVVSNVKNKCNENVQSETKSTLEENKTELIGEINPKTNSAPKVEKKTKSKKRDTKAGSPLKKRKTKSVMKEKADAVETSHKLEVKDICDKCKKEINSVKKADERAAYGLEASDSIKLKFVGVSINGKPNNLQNNQALNTHSLKRPSVDKPKQNIEATISTTDENKKVNESTEDHNKGDPLKIIDHANGTSEDKISTVDMSSKSNEAAKKVDEKLNTNVIAPSVPKKPIKKEEKAPMLLIATPRPLQKKAPQIIHSSTSSESSEDESSEDSDDESDSSSNSAEFFECENNPDGRTSTGSSDSGFDSSVPTSPAAFLYVKKGGDNASTTGLAPTKNYTHDILQKELENSTAYDLFRKTGRFTPPARSIPRFRKYNIEDFQFIKVLGKGSFGKVMLAELRETEYYYAVKCLKKDVVLEDDDVECTLIERKVLALGTNHPYLCHLFVTFQTDSHLFFVMEYLNGGDLMFHIQQSGRFPEVRARFYAAEIVSGLKFLHKRGIVYRDLKLDNILLDFDGHVRIADFGMCKLQIYLDKTADTFCGTPDYMAPEIIKGLKYNQTVDWWSFGVLLYEMLIGQSPFSGCDEDELFWSICNEMPSYPRFLSQESHTILTRFLDKDARSRLGGAECMWGDIRDQDFFRPIPWDKLERRELEAPFKPRVRHPMDTQYFDRAFTGERPRLTAIEPQVLRSMDQEAFRGFSYTNPNATDR